MSVQFVKLSAQGTYFLWKKQDVLSHDWLLSGMIREPDMAIMAGDQFYIDVDSVALRFIYNMLQGIVQESDLHHLSTIEILLIKNTAEYLLCPHIVQMSQEVINLRKNEVELIEEKLKKENDLLIGKKEKLEEKSRENEPKVAAFNSLKQCHIRGFRCQAYKTRCKYNICGQLFMVISPKELICNANIDLSVLCCGEGGPAFEQEKIDDEEDLIRILKNGCNKYY
jgi:hypothetical protein